eukprot:1525190-Amphidinium_carterae.1
MGFLAQPGAEEVLMCVNRACALGLPDHVEARITKSLHSVGLYGAEVGCGEVEENLEHIVPALE